MTRSCEVCSAPATVCCNTCAVGLCGACWEKTHALPFLQKHDKFLLPVTPVTPADDSDKKQDIQDAKAIEARNLVKGVQAELNILKEACNTIDRAYQTVTLEKQQISQVQQRVQQTLNQQFDEFKKLLEQHKLVLVKTNQDICDNKSHSIDKQSQTLKKELDQVTQTVQTLEKAFEAVDTTNKDALEALQSKISSAVKSLASSWKDLPLNLKHDAQITSELPFEFMVQQISNYGKLESSAPVKTKFQYLFPVTEANDAKPEASRVYGWGQDDVFQLGIYDKSSNNSVLSPTVLSTLQNAKVIVIVGGYQFTLALTASGKIFSWGSNTCGELGLHDFKSRRIPFEIPNLKNIVSIAAGGNHGLALTDQGLVYAWGSNEMGQLGLGDTKNRCGPEVIAALKNKKVTAIAAGYLHSAVLTDQGEVFTFGYCNSGQLGHGDTVNRSVPSEVVNLSHVTAIAAGAYHTVALTQEGTVFTFGHNIFGEAGVGAFASPVKSPQQVLGLKDIVAIFTNSPAYHTFAVTKDGRVFAWGRNDCGQLALKTKTQTHTPKESVQLTSKNIKSLACGANHTIALSTNAQVFTVGGGMEGELGFNDTQDRLDLQHVPFETSVIGIGAGFHQSFALTE